MAGLSDVNEFLKLLHKSKPSYQKILLEGASPRIVELLTHCALNILRGQILVTADQKNKLRKYKNNLRQLASKKISTKQKKKILQKGGFLPAFLIPILGPIMGGLAGAVVNKIANKVF